MIWVGQIRVFKGMNLVSPYCIINKRGTHVKILRQVRGETIPTISIPVYNLFYPIDQNACRIEPLLFENECPPDPVLICRRDLRKYCSV